MAVPPATWKVRPTVRPNEKDKGPNKQGKEMDEKEKKSVTATI